jgi:hypothetical protein
MKRGDSLREMLTRGVHNSLACTEGLNNYQSLSVRKVIHLKEDEKSEVYCALGREEIHV